MEEYHDDKKEFATYFLPWNDGLDEINALEEITIDADGDLLINVIR